MGSLGVPSGCPSVSGRDAFVELLKSKTCVGLGLDEALFTKLASSSDGQATITGFLEDERAADSPLLIYEVRSEVIRTKQVAGIAPLQPEGSATGDDGVSAVDEVGEAAASADGQAPQEAVAGPRESDARSNDEAATRRSGIAARESTSGRVSGGASAGPSRRASTLAASSRRESALVHPEPLSEASESDGQAVEAALEPAEAVEVETVVELRACLGSLPEGTAGRAVYFTKKEPGKLRSKDGLECGVLAEGPSLRALEVVRTHERRTVHAMLR